ncbi:MAG: sensor histidine kinase [Saprospiraceae bacterium]
MKSDKEILGFDDKWLILFGVPTVSLIMNAFVDDTTKSATNLISFIPDCFFISFLYTMVYWYFFRKICAYLKRKYPKHRETKKRIIYQVLGLLLFYTLIKVVVSIAIGIPIYKFIDADYPMEYPLLAGSLMVSFLIVSIYESIFFYNKLNTSLLEKEQLERENIISQLEGLKSQVNPHFLFNSLNTLSYIIPEDADRAVRFVQQLSKVYRYILEIRDDKLIHLEEELSFLESYVFLLKERFGDNLQIEIKVEKAFLNTQVVPLSLQILFENAIKHNIISTEKPLLIEVSVERGNKLLIKNNLQRKNQVMSSTKVGLQNIKNRYQFLSEKLVEVIVTANEFIVMLPLIKPNIAK